MSLEPFEEEGEKEEVVVTTRNEEEEETVDRGETSLESEEASAPVLYDVTKPELLEMMVLASDILAQASSGLMNLGKARKLYKKDVIGRIKILVDEGLIVKKSKKKAKKAVKEKPKKAKKKKGEGKKIEKSKKAKKKKGKEVRTGT